jgi:hypothetical protein
MRQHRQIHLWITESDYLLLREQSVEERESVSGILRRLIRNERLRPRDERPSAVDELSPPTLVIPEASPEPAPLDAS